MPIPQNKQNELFYRHFEIERTAINEKERSIDISFSSEEPVSRWFGQEILLHKSENIDFSRIKKTGSLLLNHDPDRILGSVSNVRLENGKSRAVITFDDDLDGNYAFNKVRTGSLKGVSFGYKINKFRELREGEEWEGYKGPVYIATRWTPYEITLTPIPADSTVGIGRSLEGIEIERNINTIKEVSIMSELNEQRIQEMIIAGIKTSTKDIVEQVCARITEQNKPQMRITLERGLELTGQAGAISIELEAKVGRMILEGKTDNEIQKFIIDSLIKTRDAKDSGGDGSDGTGMKANGEKSKQKKIIYRSLDEMSNDIFAETFKQMNTQTFN